MPIAWNDYYRCVYGTVNAKRVFHVLVEIPILLEPWQAMFAIY